MIAKFSKSSKLAKIAENDQSNQIAQFAKSAKISKVVMNAESGEVATRA